MDKKSIDQLRFDRRMMQRRDWLAAEDLEKELDSLPDVSHKIESPEEREVSEAMNPEESG